MSAGDSETRRAESLVDELTRRGVRELSRNRPYSARVAWRQALRHRDDHEEARARLAALDGDLALPATARRDLARLRPPRDADARALRDACLAASGTSNADPLAQASAAYERWTELDPDDSAAWYNFAATLAWQGRNAEAIEALGRVVDLDAPRDLDAAVDAWAIAEILRAGLDDRAALDEKHYLGYVQTTLPNVAARLRDEPRARCVAASADALAADFNLFDRPIDAVDDDPSRLAELPRFLGVVKAEGDPFWLIAEHPAALEDALERLDLIYNDVAAASSREDLPVPLAALDHEIWDAAIPPRADAETKSRLRRELIEDYYENRWIHKPRHGLNGMSPRQAALAARDGDLASRARLLAVVRVREELGTRPRLPYEGYPFDRLRRRLGLDPVDRSTVDDADLACAPAAVLETLDAAALDPHRLVEAFRSADGLRDDALAARFGREAIDRAEDLLDRDDARAILANLTRLELRRGTPQTAVDELAVAEALAGGDCRATFRQWRAEILARIDRGDEAAVIYEQMLDDADDAPEETALDAALTFVDNGRPDLAAAFAERAVELAEAADRPGVAHRARTILQSAASDHDA